MNHRQQRALRAGRWKYLKVDAHEYLFDIRADAVSYTHLRAHETVLDLVCRLLLETKKTSNQH